MISNKVSLGKKGYKYFIGYKVFQLCIALPNFDERCMSWLIKGYKILRNTIKSGIESAAILI